MPKVDTTPDGLKPYTFHGLDLAAGKRSKEVLGDCPLCGAESKFSVDQETSKWRCFVCGEKGNQYTFLKELHKICTEQDTEELEEAYGVLANSRGLEIETLKAWGLTRSILTGEWLIPGYNTKGEVTQLYRYVKMRGGKFKLLATPTMHHQIHGVNLFEPKKKAVYICEGPWDAMALWEKLKTTREVKGRFVPAKSSLSCLLNGANVLAVPGCSTFHDSWCDVFLKKKVYIVYDNDHPRKHPKTKKEIPPAAYSGAERVSGILSKKPAEINFLKWGAKGYDPDLPDGTDIRDYLNAGNTLGDLFSKLVPVPEEWLVSEKQKEAKKKQIKPTECSDWKKLSRQWGKALRWGDGLDISLSVMLASVVSTDLVGDQLWVKIVGPASCGKSTLCEAVSVNRSYVLAKSTIRGFHSGFSSNGDDEEDNSLIVQAAGKTLVTKDGDTLLQSPNLGQILSEARDIYDKTSRTHYRNKMSKEYNGINMTWLLCGTSSLRSIDSSELGERFLDCVIMDGIEDDMEDEVLARVALREDQNLSSGMSSSDDDSGGHDVEMLSAMQMTGGYVGYLRENAQQLMAEVETGKENLHLITRIGKFVAFMRARPSSMQTENAEREFAARLVSQHLRLAKCLAAVLGKKRVDKEVMRRTVKVALDTARGLTLDICTLLYDDYRKEGAEVKTLCLMTNQTQDTTIKMLRFLKAIEVVEQFQKKSAGTRARKKWRLTAKLQKLFKEVVR